MFTEYDRIVFMADLTEKDVKAGDVGTIAQVSPNAAAFAGEFLALDSHTAALAMV